MYVEAGYGDLTQWLEVGINVVFGTVVERFVQHFCELRQFVGVVAETEFTEILKLFVKFKLKKYI